MFGSLGTFFNVVLYKPLFNALVLIYEYIPGHDFGIAIIILTIVIRFILYPLSVKAVNSQKVLQSIQPKIQEAQKKYKNDKEKQAKEILEIYKQEKINPFSGLLLAFIQLPILIALYRVFFAGLNPQELANLYSFVPRPEAINSVFFHIIDLAKPNIYLAILAGIVQFYQTKMMLPKNAKSAGSSEISDIMQKQMTYIFPVFTIIILLGLPSALGLYWTISGIFTIIQQYLILKR